MKKSIQQGTNGAPNQTLIQEFGVALKPVESSVYTAIHQPSISLSLSVSVVQLIPTLTRSPAINLKTIIYLW